MPRHVQVTWPFFPFWLLAYVGFLLCHTPASWALQVPLAAQGCSAKWARWKMWVLLENWPAVRQKAAAGGHACGPAVGSGDVPAEDASGALLPCVSAVGFQSGFVLLCFLFPKKTDFLCWGSVQFLLQNVFLIKSKQRQNEICFDRTGEKILASCTLCDLTHGREQEAGTGCLHSAWAMGREVKQGALSRAREKQCWGLL